MTALFLALTRSTADALRESVGLESGDTSKDIFLSSLSEAELYERYCEAHGFIGWSEYFIEAIDRTQGIECVESLQTYLRERHIEDPCEHLVSALRAIRDAKRGLCEHCPVGDHCEPNASTTREAKQGLCTAAA